MSRIFVDVDVQHDFCDPAGALYVPGSPNDVFVKLTGYAASHRIPILGSVDSHAWDAWEFASSGRAGPSGERPGFPDHCVKGTRGWLKVPGTLPERFRFVAHPGTRGGASATDQSIDALVAELVSGQTQAVYFEKEVYSLFANPLAERVLAALAAALGGSPELVVYGVATDYCVRAAALGLAQRGYRTTVLTDAVAGITAEGTHDAFEEMRRAGVAISTATALLAAAPVATKRVADTEEA